MVSFRGMVRGTWLGIRGGSPLLSSWEVEPKATTPTKRAPTDHAKLGWLPFLEHGAGRQGCGGDKMANPAKLLAPSWGTLEEENQKLLGGVKLGRWAWEEGCREGSGQCGQHLPEKLREGVGKCPRDNGPPEPTWQTRLPTHPQLGKRV